MKLFLTLLSLLFAQELDKVSFARVASALAGCYVISTLSSIQTLAGAAFLSQLAERMSCLTVACTWDTTTRLVYS